MWCLRQTKVAGFGILHLLGIEVYLILVSIVIKVLIDGLLFVTACVVLTQPHLLPLGMLILKGGIDPDLIV